jgi:hypothetical protein
VYAIAVLAAKAITTITPPVRENFVASDIMNLINRVAALAPSRGQRLVFAIDPTPVASPWREYETLVMNFRAMRRR